MAPSRKRNVLTSQEKKEIIRIKEEHPGFKYADVAEEYYKRSKRSVSTSTICSIINHRDAILMDLPYSSKYAKKQFSISNEVIYKVKEARANDKLVTEAYVIEKAWEQVRKHRLDESLYVFTAEWASNILKGQRDDYSILKRNLESNGNQNQDQRDSSGLSLLLSLSSMESSSLIENKSVPFSSTDVTAPSVEVTPITSEMAISNIPAAKNGEATLTPKPQEVPLAPKPQEAPEVPKSKEVKSENSLVDLQSFLVSIGEGRDYRSVLYSLLEKSYQENPYYAPIMRVELENVRKTLHFMVEKEGKVWYILCSNKQITFINS